jgi:hypothetical protein
VVSIHPCICQNLPLHNYSPDTALAYLPDKIDQIRSDGSKEIEVVVEVDENLSSSMFGCQIPTEECPDDVVERSQEEKWEFILSQFRSWAPE